MERTFETPGPVRLYVENEVGSVTITARETATTEVSLIPDTPGAEELIERATVEQRKDTVIVKLPHLHGMRFLRRNGVTIRIVVPEGSSVTAVTGSADVDVTGLLGAADLTTASGDVTTDDVTKEVRAKTASGDFTVGSVGGELRMTTASGSLRCSRVGGRATFSTASGDVEIGSAGDRVEVQATSGHVRLGELARGARVVNVSGDVRVLALSEGSAARALGLGRRRRRRGRGGRAPRRRGDHVGPGPLGHPAWTTSPARHRARARRPTSACATCRATSR